MGYRAGSNVYSGPGGTMLAALGGISGVPWCAGDWWGGVGVVGRQQGLDSRGLNILISSGLD